MTDNKKAEVLTRDIDLSTPFPNRNSFRYLVTFDDGETIHIISNQKLDVYQNRYVGKRIKMFTGDIKVVLSVC